MKLSTKLIIGLFAFLIIVILFYAFSLKQVDFDFVYVGDGDNVPNDACDIIGDKVLVVTKTGCPACAKIEPILKEIESEVNLEFEYVNTAKTPQRDKLLEMGFIPIYVPSVIINCKVHSGALEKEEYLELLK